MGRGRAPCCDKSKVKRGPWSPSEDLRLTSFIQKFGHDNWRSLPKQAGLMRCGKSCRLRWINYLRPDVKRGNFTKEEEDTIISLHRSIGNKLNICFLCCYPFSLLSLLFPFGARFTKKRELSLRRFRWSRIAAHLPGRTDNEIKNVWNTYLKKRLPSPTKEISPSASATLSASSSSSALFVDNVSAPMNQNVVGLAASIQPLPPPPHPFAQTETQTLTQTQDGSSKQDFSTSTGSSSSASVQGYGSGSSLDQASNALFSILGPGLENASGEVDKPNHFAEGNSMGMEVPLEFDEDFWNLFDNLDPMRPQMEGMEVWGEEEVGMETEGEAAAVENRNWLKRLEMELGLEAGGSVPCDDDL